MTTSCRKQMSGHWAATRTTSAGLLPTALMMLMMLLTTTMMGQQVDAFAPTSHTVLSASSTSTSESRVLPLLSTRLWQASFDNDAPPTMPERKAKHQGRKKRTRRQSIPNGPGSPLSEEELRHHVSTQYIHGPSGKRKQAIKASQSSPYNTGTTAAAAGATDGEGSMAGGEQSDYLKKLDRHTALVLNADYQPLSYLPLSAWTWQETIKGVFSGKVTVVDVYPDVTIRAATLEIPLPSVIALNDYVQPPNSKPAFTKRNVFLRDEYRCQYCSHRFHTRDLSLDHVIPRCRGGRLNWENAVTSCRTCNGRKGSLPLSQLKSVGMRLAKEPYVPTQYELHKTASRMLPRKVHSTWAPFLAMNNPSQENIVEGATQEECEAYLEGEL